jgi:hypothetical protein
LGQSFCLHLKKKTYSAGKPGTPHQAQQMAKAMIHNLENGRYHQSSFFAVQDQDPNDSRIIPRAGFG